MKKLCFVHLCAVGALTMVGCIAGADEVASDDSDLHVKPGDEENLAHLIVQLPSGACQLPAACAHPVAYPTFNVEGASYAAPKLGEDARLKPGNYSVVVEYAAMPLTLAAKQTRKVTLAVARSKCTALPLPVVPKTDFGSKVSVWNEACPVTMQAAVPKAGYAAFPYVTLLGSDRIFAPGSYTVSLGGKPQTVSLAEGDVKEIPFTRGVVGTVPPLFTTKIAFVDPRENPTVALTALAITSSCPTDAKYQLPLDGAQPVALDAFQSAQCSYTLTVGGRSLALDQTKTNVVNLYRVDVDDVLVQKEDKTSYLAKGTYQLFFAGLKVAGPHPTGTGIDMLPGTYELVINYNTMDGPKTQKQTLTL